MIVRTLRIGSRRVAATAPQESDSEAAERTARGRLPPEVADMCAQWGAWVATRRLAAPRPLGSVLGNLRAVHQMGTSEGPHLRLDADLAAFHAALQQQEERARAVLYGLYALPAMTRQRVPVKRIASALEISRQHVYRLRDSAAQTAFRQRHAVLEAARAMLGTGSAG